jgi:hypothetical protein
MCRVHSPWIECMRWLPGTRNGSSSHIRAGYRLAISLHTLESASGQLPIFSSAPSATIKTRPDGRLAWRFQLSPTLASFIRPTPDGDLMMPAISDMGEGVVVIRTPANPFILKGIKPGESRSYMQRVVVNELDDPTDQKYSGSLNGTFSYLGTYLVTVPAGNYPAVLFASNAMARSVPLIHTIPPIIFSHRAKVWSR